MWQQSSPFPRELYNLILGGLKSFSYYISNMKDFSDLIVFCFCFFFTLLGDTIDDQSRESKDKTSFPETRPMYNPPPQVGDLLPYGHMMKIP